MPRKQHKYHYIYKTTCLITGRYYIGMHSTSNLEDDYVGSGKRLWKSIKKHGKENHVKEILEWFEDRSSLKNREKELVNESLLQDPNCMNLVRGGEGGIFNEDHHLKMRKGSSAWISKKLKEPNFFKKNREISSIRFKNMHKNKQINYKTLLGKSLSEETKKKIGESNSISQKGNKNSQFGTMWVTNGKESIKIKKDQLIPNGWIKGRTLKK